MSHSIAANFHKYLFFVQYLNLNTSFNRRLESKNSMKELEFNNIEY